MFLIGCNKDDDTNDNNDATVTDIDGNVYHTVTIGTQVWMVENLKTTKYRNGEEIINVTDFHEWSTLATGAFCWFDNDTTYKINYGALYNWYAAIDTRNISPLGWHVPSDDEWTILTNFLGGESVAGGKMKETGTSHWWGPNTGATNESGFTALPGGHKSIDPFHMLPDIGMRAFWWSSSELSDSAALCWSINYTESNLWHGYSNKQAGFSVRLVRD